MADEKDPRYWDLHNCAWVPSPRVSVGVPEQPRAADSAPVDPDDVAVAPV
jgi:hypothetical protein